MIKVYSFVPQDRMYLIFIFHLLC